MELFSNCSGLKTIYTFNPVPPTAKGAFDVTYQNATLYVPQESIEAYKAADSWKYFQHIQGFDTTEIKDINADASRQKDVYYDINGRKLSAPRKGLNIINGKKRLVK